jgi:hypothetical protein
MQYHHTQYGKLNWLLAGIGWIEAVSGVLIGNHPAALALFAGAAGLILLSLGFSRLTVEGDERRILLCYGPLPIFWRHFDYSRIRSAEPGRTSWVDGWGIHYVPGRGWTYNLWGFDCVVLDLGGKTIRIGTDDPEGLASFLQAHAVAAGR